MRKLKKPTEREVVLATNKLARTFYSLMGYQVDEDFEFFRAEFLFARRLHPQETLCWQMACEAQRQLTGADVKSIDIMSVLDDEE